MTHLQGKAVLLGHPVSQKLKEIAKKKSKMGYISGFGRAETSTPRIVQKKGQYFGIFRPTIK
jgi:hypothetical protein